MIYAASLFNRRSPSRVQCHKASERSTITALVIALVLLLPPLISIYLHDPDIILPVHNYGLKYTDIVHGLSAQIFTSSKRWFNNTAYEEFTRGVHKCPLPYIDYKFEYPPLIGLTWYFSTCIAFNYAEDLKSAIRVHYYVQSAITTVFYIILITALTTLLEDVKPDQRSLLGILIYLLPSTIIFFNYNWDIVAAALVVTGVLRAIKKRYFQAGLLQGLSVSAKILTVGVVFYYIIKLRLVESEKRALLKYVTGFSASGVALFVALAVISPRGFTEFLSHHAGWYCENCLYLPIVRDIYSELHKLLFYFTTTLIACGFVLLAKPWSGISTRDEYKYLFAATTSLVLFNYVFSPQMLLLITPFAVLALNSTTLALYGLADVFNALIIVTYFQNPTPWEYGSTTQNMALVRNLALLALFIVNTIHILQARYESIRRIAN